MKRTDKYGGNFVNRVRFLKEIMEEVRKNVGPDFPVTVRFSAIEEAVGGRTMEESRPLAMLLEQWGAGALHISASVYGNHINGIISSMYTPRAWLVDYAQEVKQLVKIPVFTVNHIADPFVAESILAAGKADIIGMGRESLAEPEFPNKAKAGMLRISERFGAELIAPLLRVKIFKILDEYYAKRLNGTRILEFMEDGVLVENEEKGQYKIPAQQIVLALGYKPVNNLEEIARKVCDDVVVIRGAVKTSNAAVASCEGLFAGMNA